VAKVCQEPGQDCRSLKTFFRDINVTVKKIILPATKCRRCDTLIQKYFLLCLIVAIIVLYNICMKENKKDYGYSVCNVPMITFNLSKEIWDSESLIDEIDFNVPDQFYFSFKRWYKKGRKKKCIS